MLCCLSDSIEFRIVYFHLGDWSGDLRAIEGMSCRRGGGCSAHAGVLGWDASTGSISRGNAGLHHTFYL